eukprot:8939148-Alexandrium_andersonii.AAC.1
MAPGRTRRGMAQGEPGRSSRFERLKRARRGLSTATPPPEQFWTRSWWRRPARRRSSSCSPGRCGRCDR